MSENVQLTPRQRLALAALLSGGTHEEAAVAARVTTKTVQRWRQQDAFAEALDDYAREAVRSASAQLAGTLDTAVATLCEVMLDDTQPAGLRLRAANHVINAALKLLPADQGAVPQTHSVRLSWGE